MATIILQGDYSSYSFDPRKKASFIGEGGMGRVFKGVDLKTNEPVAIKVLFKELTDNVKIVERESQNAQIRVSHKNLVKQLDFIKSDGKYHTISKYFEGEPLDEYIEKLHKSSKFDEDTAMSIIKQILDGLSALHNNEPRIVHRDIKPSNVLIDAKTLHVKILDFGIAKITGDKRKSKTGIGTVIGSIYYSPPEQIKGKHDIVDERSDVYSAAIVLFKMLTGVVPFEGTEYEIMKHQVETSLPPNESIEPSLFKVLLKASAKDMDERYSSVKAFYEALVHRNDVIDASELDTVKRHHATKIKQVNVVWILSVLVVLISAFVAFNWSQSSKSSNSRIISSYPPPPIGTTKNDSQLVIKRDTNEGSTNGNDEGGKPDTTKKDTLILPTPTIDIPLTVETIRINIAIAKGMYNSKKYIDAHNLVSLPGYGNSSKAQTLRLKIERDGFKHYSDLLSMTTSSKDRDSACKLYNNCKNLNSKQASKIQNKLINNCR